MKIPYEGVHPYITKDGSVIRELIHPSRCKGAHQSLAEATVYPKGKTLLHVHKNIEEIYHISQGKGIMTLGEETFKVCAGDSVFIPAGIPHKLENTGLVPMKIICCCYPPYSHDDTELIE